LVGVSVLIGWSFTGYLAEKKMCKMKNTPQCQSATFPFAQYRKNS